MSEPIAVGIDLGTTHSLAAVLTGEGPRVVPNALGNLLTPSVVAIDDAGQVVVGEAAQHVALWHPERAAARFKRYMGSDRTLTLAQQAFTPVELSALVLRSVKRDVEVFVGRPVEAAVISVPAYFNDAQRAATQQAATLAGLEVLRLVNEPTAAAIAHGLHAREAEETLVVLDLGGGTFDVTLLDLFEGVVEVRASAGDNQLGGEDFTDALVQWALDGADPEPVRARQPTVFARLRSQCEAAKRQLADGHGVLLPVPAIDGEDTWRTVTTRRVTAATLDECTPLLRRRLRAPITRVLHDTGVRPDAVGAVLLVGGASRMTAFRALAEEVFGRAPTFGRDPDLIVAEGAAVQAGLIRGSGGLEDLVVTDVTAFSLGVEIVREVGDQKRGGYFSTVIPRGTTLPASRSDVYHAIERGQRKIRFTIYQGESRRVSDNERIGEVEVTGLGRSGERDAVELRLTHDLDGLLQVEARPLDAQGVPIGPVFEGIFQRGRTHLAPKALQRALARLAALKIHPREQLPNRHLVSRAEAAIRGLLGRERAFVEEVLDAFEAALAGQVPAEIERVRQTLESVLDEIERR